MNVSSYQPGSHGMPAQSSGVSSVDTPGVHLKKMSLPTFSGQRKDWPEFKTVWKQLAEGAVKNKTALAHELKRSVKGEATMGDKSVETLSNKIEFLSMLVAFSPFPPKQC